eukprot:gnl/TRDRNA2_/TRDRNA2_177456_c0_seq1.p1 gnl/TRDRNA2_/TRDRNA2_177456_c0~~gnl/TRDRNA2_/TRDRNA2_177456_c0_seq1.p1  ORF type:complete len:354 (+),score=-32.14 gnl/TRDRNA2_/TRDRNA2_177456_c0_seq1:143-1204(+)
MNRILMKSPQTKKIVLNESRSNTKNTLAKTHFIEALELGCNIAKKSVTSVLMSYLNSVNQVTEMVVLDLWKGLFNCLWHSEPIFIQTFLGPYLSSLILNLTQKSSLIFFECFFMTMKRELFGTDKYRIDKIVALAENFLESAINLINSKTWDPKILSSYITTLAQEYFLKPYSDTYPRSPCATGTYHLAYILVTFISRESHRSEQKLPRNMFLLLLEPIAQILIHSNKVHQSIVNPTLARALDIMGDKILLSNEYNMKIKPWLTIKALFRLMTNKELSKHAHRLIWNRCDLLAEIYDHFLQQSIIMDIHLRKVCNNTINKRKVRSKYITKEKLEKSVVSSVFCWTAVIKKLIN